MQPLKVGLCVVSIPLHCSYPQPLSGPTGSTVMAVGVGVDVGVACSGGGADVGGEGRERGKRQAPVVGVPTKPLTRNVAVQGSLLE